MMRQQEEDQRLGRRLVGIDLGIASRHSVRVLEADGNQIPPSRQERARQGPLRRCSEVGRLFREREKLREPLISMLAQIDAFDPQRALAEEELVSLELAVQAIWMYCAYINGEVEQGNDPVIGDGYGCCFLRAARSRLVNLRPQETGQHRSMRDAVVETSGLPAHLALAMDALKEAGGK